jgi:hypothetical protein
MRGLEGVRKAVLRILNLEVGKSKKVRSMEGEKV